MYVREEVNMYSRTAVVSAQFLMEGRLLLLYLEL
jgi:hypothetical protein